jgi:endonuclease/exonuclease/phosphatase family metal-dependent hydrolase
MAKEGDPKKVTQSLEGAPRLQDADLYLFQEVRQDRGKPSVAEQAAQKQGYFATFRPSPGFTDQGLAMVSRYPLTNIATTPLKAYDLRFHSRNRFALAATMKTPWGDVRVWNVHLDTRINADERLAQLQPVMEAMKLYRGPRLIGGDFNTNSFHWVGNVLPVPFAQPQGSAVQDSMKQIGFESPLALDVTTHPLLRSHLDWIFLSDLKVVGASVEPAAFSDHNAVWIQAQM